MTAKSKREKTAKTETVATWDGIVGENDVKADTWYTLKGGKLVEV